MHNEIPKPEETIKTELVAILERQLKRLETGTFILDQNYPVYESSDGELLITKVMVISQTFGVVLFAPAELTNQSPSSLIDETVEHLEDIAGEIMSKLTKEKRTRKFGTEDYVHSVLYTPYMRKDVTKEGIHVSKSESDLITFFSSQKKCDLSDDEFLLVQSVVEMSNRLRKPKRRTLIRDDSKGRLASRAELEISTFDRRQQDIFMREINGPERIKGLAGSGKTVVLCAKAAILQAMYPEAKIAFTYYTKSVHQQIVRLIAEFFNGITGREPNWENLNVLHGWGGKRQTGFYHTVCRENLVPSLSLGAAAMKSAEPFDYACKKLLNEKLELKKLYDYVFIDEGQDFPSSFLRLAKKVTRKDRIVWAYDAFQNIFNVKAPKAEEIFDDLTREGLDDHALYKCYRNSSEVLVTAHSLGFGIYGEIIQMLDSNLYWEDLGYKVTSGELKPGRTVTIERPSENSLQAISKESKKEEIVSAKAFATMDNEIQWVIQSIVQNYRQDELRLDDIMVISVDQYAGGKYLEAIEFGLSEAGIKANNLYADPDGGQEFWKENEVTLAQVRRAKGNEAYMVYVVGTDALFEPTPTAVSRNMLFTAITRAKGWVRITGTGETTSPWIVEINQALSNAPAMIFKYPEKSLEVMERELQKVKNANSD